MTTQRTEVSGLRLAAYLRVSTLRQQEDGHGLDGQERAIRMWAASGGTEVVSVFCDAGVPGVTDRAQRPQLSAAFELLTRGAVDALVVARLDRLARALTVQEAILASVWATGSVVCTADEGLILQDDPTDPMRTAMRQMMGVFAQLERSMGRHTLRQAKIAMRAKGLHTDGHYQFGWRRGGKDPREQRVLRLGRRLHREGATWTEVASILNARGVRYAPRDGTWTGSRARSLLRPRPTPPEKARRWAANPPPVRGRLERIAPPRPTTWLDSGQAATILGVGIEVVRQLARNGRLPHVIYRTRYVFDIGAVAILAVRCQQFDAEWMPVHEAATAFRIAPNSVRRWARDGRIPSRTNLFGQICVPRDQVLRYLPARIVTIGATANAARRPQRSVIRALASSDDDVPHLDGAKLRRARQCAGLSQRQLAAATGVASVETISCWERGLQRPWPGQVGRLATALDVSVLELMTPATGMPTLRGLRLLRGLTLQEVAARVGTALTTYHRLERGLPVRQPDDASSG